MNRILALLSFLLPFILYSVTCSDTLMFDDAAEFAVVIKLGSIAHPPGVPSYILSAMLWEKLTALFSLPTILSLSFYSALCVSLAAMLLYFTFRKMLSSLSENELYKNLSALFTSLGFALAPTTWIWANTIEVYGFQLLTMALALFGLVRFNITRDKKWLIAAAAGLGLGLSNHHVTMIMFLPFVPVFFISNLFSPSEKTQTSSKKKATKRKSFIQEYFSVFWERNFWMMAAGAGLITIAFYGWMFYRAQSEYLYMFARPHNLDELLFHMRGGAYTKNITQTSGSIMSARVPFFLKLTAVQLGVFLPLLFLGLYQLSKHRMMRIGLAAILYFLILFFYQINNNQWASTDAYMLLPFMLLMIPVLYGINGFIKKWKLAYILPLFIIGNTIYLYPSHNRNSYPVGEDLMKLLDSSAPENSVVLISDWTTVMLYYYHRIVENFRPDLIVLNYDIKFTHYRILPLNYPEFHEKIKHEYKDFLDELRKEHPYQATTTGCDLSTESLMNKFRKLVLKIESTAKEQNRIFLTDPRAHVFYMKEKIYNPSRYVSGCFMSTVPGDSLSAAEFLRMDFPYLSSPLMMNDAGALDKLVDFQAMLDQHISFYELNNDRTRLEQARQAHARVMKLQREMKKNMSFAYKIK